MASRKPLVIASQQLQQIQPGDTLGDRGTVTGSTANPTSSNASFVVIPEMTVSLTTAGGSVLVLFDCTFNIQTVDSFSYAIFLDGVVVAGATRQVTSSFSLSLGLLTLDDQQPASVHALLTLAAGAHTIDVRWARLGGTARAFSTQRKLSAIELF